MTGKIKVLLVEDNYMNKVLVREILTINKYEVIEARNGIEALGVLARDRPDLILMDMHLPEMDGITATRIIKSNEAYRDIPVLAITAAVSKSDEEELLGKGFDGFISKPVEFKDLLESISTALRGKKPGA
ncbi:MAG: response regulator [Deltaproteobacteria bacterium]|nr:response regulator [Deltaproteobacteria bacterium]